MSVCVSAFLFARVYVPALLDRQPHQTKLNQIGGLAASKGSTDNLTITVIEFAWVTRQEVLQYSHMSAREALGRTGGSFGRTGGAGDGFGRTSGGFDGFGRTGAGDDGFGRTSAGGDDFGRTCGGGVEFARTSGGGESFGRTSGGAEGFGRTSAVCDAFGRTSGAADQGQDFGRVNDAEAGGHEHLAADPAGGSRHRPAPPLGGLDCLVEEVTLLKPKT